MVHRHHGGARQIVEDGIRPPAHARQTCPLESKGGPQRAVALRDTEVTEHPPDLTLTPKIDLAGKGGREPHGLPGAWILGDPRPSFAVRIATIEPVETLMIG